MSWNYIVGIILLVLLWCGICGFLIFSKSKKFNRRMRGVGHLANIFGIGLFIFAIGYGLSWIVTCGIIKLITLCFGLTFKWSVATGIWLAMILLKSVFKSNTTVKTK